MDAKCCLRPKNLQKRGKNYNEREGILAFFDGLKRTLVQFIKASNPIASCLLLQEMQTKVLELLIHTLPQETP